MAHEINKEADGSYSFVQVANAERSLAWHRLGQTVDKAMTAEEALRLGGMDWEVVLEPIFVSTMDENGEPDVMPVPNKMAVCRHTPTTEILGVVGERYTPVQNREAFAFMDGVVDRAGGAHYDTAGFLRPERRDGTHGAQIFLTIDLGDAGNIVLDPKGANDQIVTHLACCTSHDGSMAFTVLLTPVRIVCANTQAMALKGARQQWRIKHTSGIQGRMQEARDTLNISLKYLKEFEAIAQRLIHEDYSEQQFGRYARQVYPVKPDATDRIKRTNMEVIDRLQWIWKEAPTNENIRGTKWAAYQTVTEFIDWYRPVRGPAAQADSRRAADAIVGPGVARKARALQLLAN